MVNEVRVTQAFGENGDGQIIRYTTGTTAISYGAILKLTSAYTAAQADTVNGAIAGIAAADKETGKTSIGVMTNFVGDFVASGSITVGAPVIYAGGVSNEVQAGDASDKGSEIIGYARETVTDGQTVSVRVNL